MVNIDGTGLQDLTPPGMIADFPVWSPDGTRIAFHNITGRPFHLDAPRDIWLMDADGKNLEQLTKHQGADMYPEWASY